MVIVFNLESPTIKYFILPVLATSLFISSCGGKGDSKKVEDCVKRGIQYFKDIGSYPTLSSAPNRGRSASAVARERCNRTTTAF